MSVPYKKILLPLDGSDVAAQALPHAEEIARNQGATLVLFSVVEDSLGLLVTGMGVATASAGGTIGVGPVLLDDATHTKAMDAAKQDLDELATSLRHRKVNVITDMDTGNPAECIVDYANHNDVDLIVMSTHGHTGAGRWTFGSVTNKVLQAASCSVFVVRAEEIS